jgi:2-hydroxy-3-oxopropionate reductase
MAGSRGTVGLIGLGQMGGAMCRTLATAGWRVIAWDLSASARDAAAGSGADIATGPAEVGARASIVITSLPDAAAVRAAALGPDGLAMPAGGLLVDTSTTTPDEARALAADLESTGVGFLDSPVSGGVTGASSGSLAVMVGGDEALFERARPVLASIGRTVVRCGSVGAGQIAKACNQLIVMATHEAVAEALALANASGLDPWSLREVLLSGYAASPILEIQGPRMLEHRFEPGGRARFHLKDIATLSALAAATGLHLPAFEAAAHQVQRLVAEGGGDLDNSALITLVETRAG